LDAQVATSVPALASLKGQLTFDANTSSLEWNGSSLLSLKVRSGFLFFVNLPISITTRSRFNKKEIGVSL